jgi:hypothetical protein
MRSEDGFDVLRDRHNKLVKAGAASLLAAYRFGQVCDELSRLYTQATMAAVIGVTPPTVSTYRKLFLKYPNEHVLLHVAEEMNTYDVSKLNGSVPGAPVHYVFKCKNCGSSDVSRLREKLEPVHPVHTGR